MDREVISGNFDQNEATFEGVVQTALCDIGWSNELSVLKTLVVVTDVGTKYAGDAKSVSIIEPHDGKCHVDSSGIEQYGLDMDYPSAGLVGEVLKQRKLSVIFVTSKLFAKEYEAIISGWKGVSSVVTVMSEGAKNIVELLQNSRKLLNSKFLLYYQPAPDVSIKNSAFCPRDNAENTDDMCINVEKNDAVIFQTKLTFNAPAQRNRLRVSISTFGSMDVDYSSYSECSCLTDVKTKKVELCNYHGILACGLCECDEGWNGLTCNCNIPEATSINRCTRPGTQSPCSDRGTCECGACGCNIAEDGSPFLGEYCECGKTRCTYFESNLCGGPERGQCVCNDCQCNPRYTGGNCGKVNCSHPAWSENCIAPIGRTDICSSHGKCTCGTCVCNPNFRGTYCETKTTPYICPNFVEYVHCAVFKKTTGGKECNFTEHTVVFDTKIVLDYACSYKLKDEDCHIRYNFKEKDYRIVINVKQFNKEQECLKAINWIYVSLGVFGGMVLLGILAVSLFFLLIYLYNRSQYQKFEEEQKKVAFEGEANPLYAAPTEAATNPLDPTL